MFGLLKKIFGSAQDRILRKYRKIVVEINQWEEKFQTLTDEALRQKTVEFKERLSKGETTDQLLPEAFAVVKNACRRMIGTEIHVSGYDQSWDMVPYDEQLIGAIALHKGSIAEMMTGEGKTLTAIMPIYLNALTGKPVHLATVNDYLAERDCQWVGEVYRWLGLTTGVLTRETPQELRKKLYSSDIVYGTASEFGFDYLRDNSIATHANQQVQRGHYYALIDEVDSILIDEARTPLIISGPSAVSRQMYDELKQGVAELVRYQQNLCNRLASEARRTLEKLSSGTVLPATRKEKKDEAEERDEALRKLWLVGKGMPRNKVLTHIKEDPDVRAGIDKWDLYYFGDQNKEERAKALSSLYIIVDEKANEFELTDLSINSWPTCTHGTGSNDDFVMLDISHEFLKIDENADLDAEEKIKRRLSIQDEDHRRKERSHNLRQLLRAHLLMERDVDYIVQDGKIVIIDENTGRAQPGRRFSDGLHQAIEAKEGVEIQRETQTYATITLQNYFRMYEKLSGMTGTATTEAGEFKQTYGVEVLEIPTHRRCARKDFNDEIYMSEREKYNAILKEVRRVNEEGRPILLGTESVEISEKLSRIFKLNKLEHTVLNAKQNDKEAEIIAHAGKRGAITIATNMAGRGTDIKLGQGVAEIGGLYVMGTTRHQSRRIDRQLRGRSARQGDPGNSKFFVSFEDQLLRLFASPRLTSLIQRFRPEEGEPISASILDKSIETAQKRIEQRNAAIRKHTLEYDDVMNKQRQEIYRFRNDIIHATDPSQIAIKLLENACYAEAEKFFVSRATEDGWDPEGYRQWLMTQFPVSFPERFFDDDLMDGEELAKMASDKIIEAFMFKLDHENKKIALITPPGTSIIMPANEAVRNLMVKRIDHLWQEHLLRMDHLRTDVSLRAVGNRDPLLEFKQDAFEYFDEFNRYLRTDVANDLFHFEIVVRPPQPLQDILMRSQKILAEQDASQEPSKQGRNELCGCGSGKKQKKCCGEQS